MAITIGTIGKYGQTSGSYPWTITTASTIDTSGAEALLVIILNSSASKGTPTVKFGGSGGTSMTLLGSRTNGSNGKLFLFGLMAPTQTTTGSLYVNNPSENGDNTTIIVLPLSGVDLVNPWGAISFGNGVNGAAISFTNTTTAAGSTVLGIHTSVYGPGAGGMTESGGTPTITAVTDAAVDSSCVIKVFRQEVTASGGTAVGSGTINYSDHMIYQLEVKGSSGPPKQTLTATGIDSTAALGAPLVKDPNKALLGPLSIDNSGNNAMGGPTVTRSTVAYYDRNGAGNVTSGSPATVVERTSVSSNYRVSTAAVPVVNGEKKYWEITVDAIAATSIPAFGVGVLATPLDAQLGGYQSDAISWDASGGARDNNTGLNGKATFAAGDILMIAVDMVNGWIFMGKNGHFYNGSTQDNVNFTSGDGKVNNTNRSTSIALYPAVQTQTIGDKMTTNFGKSAFAYTPPSGFTALDSSGPGKKTLNAPAIDGSADNALGAHTIANKNLVLNPTGLASTSAMGGFSVIMLASVSGLVNTSVLGTPIIVYKMTPAGLLNSSSLGSPALVQLIKPTGIGSGEALGSVSLAQRLNPPGLDTTAALGDPSLKASYSMAVPGIANAPALGDPTVKASYSFAVPSILNASVIGDASVKQQISVASYVNTSALGTFGVNQGIKAGGLENITEYGNPTVVAGKVVLSPAGLAASPALGTPSLNYKVNPAGINNASVLGDVFITHIYEGAGLYPPSIANASEFGAPQINQKIIMSGILADASVLGDPKVVAVPKLIVGSIVNTNAFGQFTVKLFVRPTGIQNDSALGDLAAVAKVQVPSLGPTSALGDPSLKASIKIYPAGIQNVSGFGDHIVSAAKQVFPAGIENISEYGNTRLVSLLYGLGIINASALGMPAIVIGDRQLTPGSIINVNTFGNPTVSLVVGDETKFINDNGTWKAVTKLLVRYENTWQEMDAIFEKKDGVWAKIY